MPACDARMSRPNTMSRARTTAVIAMYAATKPRPGVAGVPVYAGAKPMARASDVAGVVMVGPLLRRGDDELRGHRVVPQAAVLEAQDAIRARCAERIANDVGEARHRLRLGDESVVRFVHAEAVIHVG